MSISYRLKKKELILLLDLFGDAGSLEQKFGDVFISRAEYRSTAESLHKKGYVTVSEGRITADNGTAFIMKRIFDSPLVFSDGNADGWLYCSEKMMIFIDLSPVFTDEFRITTAVSDEEKTELSESLEGRKFTAVRGREDMALCFSGEHLYEEK